MKEYGKIANGGLVEARWFENAPSQEWLPFKEANPPTYNSETEEIVEISPLIEPDGITRQWQILTLAERRPRQNEVFISPVPNNRNYVPRSISLRQFRMALKRVNLFSKIAELKNSPYLDQTQKDDLTEFLEYSNIIERNHPLIEAFAPMLGVTSEQIDQVFQLADTL